jgi:hypothetical protein
MKPATTTEVAVLLGTARRNIQNYCKRHNVTKRGRDYDISARDIAGMRRELGKPGRPPKNSLKSKPT